MKQISVIFSKSTSKLGIFSWLIMWAEKTLYSHVAVRYIDADTGLPVYVQASHTMCNTMGEPEFLSQEQIIYKFDFQVDEKLDLDMKKFAINTMGVPYGTLSIVGLAWVQFMKYFGKSIDNPFREVGATYVCSQFVAALLENANIPALQQEDLDNMTPALLYPIVAALPSILMPKI